LTGSTPDHFFRHEYGRLVATLSRRVGMRHLELCEDAAQSALLAALESWPFGTPPENPSAWLFRVAENHVIGELRRRARRERLAGPPDPTLLDAAAVVAPTALLAGELPDDLLRMLFVCCDPSIARESQLAIALKTLCGFDVREIADRLLTTEANVYKRLGRARSRLREIPLEADAPSSEMLRARLPAVQSILYLMFTEGHLSSHPEAAIRRELCDEAKRLTRILAAHRGGATPSTFALLALMHLHAARMAARQAPAGGLLLLEEQDRSLWDRDEIHVGLDWLARSAEGDVFSRYHAEAGIAAEHCLAASFEETRWERIVECYALLERFETSALHTLNRAVAVAEWRGPSAGLAVLEGIEPPLRIERSYMWEAVLADLHRRSGHEEPARLHRRAAIESAPSHFVRELLRRRLGEDAR
jgi:RNA polymerase sigma-70 factor (ECF subfamily)